MNSVKSFLAVSLVVAMLPIPSSARAGGHFALRRSARLQSHCGTGALSSCNIAPPCLSPLAVAPLAYYSVPYAPQLIQQQVYQTPVYQPYAQTQAAGAAFSELSQALTEAFSRSLEALRQQSPPAPVQQPAPPPATYGYSAPLATHAAPVSYQAYTAAAMPAVSFFSTSCPVVERYQTGGANVTVRQRGLLGRVRNEVNASGAQKIDVGPLGRVRVQ